MILVWRIDAGLLCTVMLATVVDPRGAAAIIDFIQEYTA